MAGRGRARRLWLGARRSAPSWWTACSKSLPAMPLLRDDQLPLRSVGARAGPAQLLVRVCRPGPRSKSRIVPSGPQSKTRRIPRSGVSARAKSRTRSRGTLARGGLLYALATGKRSRIEQTELAVGAGYEDLLVDNCPSPTELGVQGARNTVDDQLRLTMTTS